MAGWLYFAAADGKRVRELWRSSRPSRGTKLVKDVWRGAKGSRPMGLTRLGTKLVFTADHPAYAGSRGGTNADCRSCGQRDI